MDIFSKVQYGIAVLAAGWLLVNYVRPKINALRFALARKVIAATKSVADASRSVSTPVSHWYSAKAE